MIREKIDGRSCEASAPQHLWLLPKVGSNFSFCFFLCSVVLGLGRVVHNHVDSTFFIFFFLFFSFYLLILSYQFFSYILRITFLDLEGYLEQAMYINC